MIKLEVHGCKNVGKINARLVDEAAKTLGAKSRTEAVHIALREIVSLRRFKN